MFKKGHANEAARRDIEDRLAQTNEPPAHYDPAHDYESLEFDTQEEVMADAGEGTPDLELYAGHHIISFPYDYDTKQVSVWIDDYQWPKTYGSYDEALADMNDWVASVAAQEEAFLEG